MDLTTAAAAGPQQQPQTAAEASNSTASASSSSNDRSIPSLHNACREGDVAAVERFLHEGVSVNALSVCGRTPLETAIMNGQASMVQLLLAHGADLHHSRGGMSMLDVAVQCSTVEVAKVLLEAGAKGRMWPEGYSGALLRASYNLRCCAPAMVKMLLEDNNQHTEEGLYSLLRRRLNSHVMHSHSYDVAAQLMLHLEQKQPGSTASMLNVLPVRHEPAAVSLALLKGWAGDSGDAAEQAAAASQERDITAQSQAVRELLVGLAAGGLESEGLEDASVEVCSPAASAVDDLGAALGRVSL